MNVSGVGLSAYEVVGMKAVVSSLVADVDTATEIVFVANTGGRAYDPGTGTVSYAETSTTVSGWLSALTLDQVGKIDGAQLGDVIALVRADDLTTEPDTGDRFSVGTTDYRIYRTVRGPLDTHFNLYAQRVS